LRQDFNLAECEVLISDDFSVDESCEAVERSVEWKSINARVKCAALYKQRSNLGLIGNFDYLFKRATGHVIIPVAGDDWLEPNCLSIAWKLLKDVKIGMAFSNGYYESRGKSALMYSSKLKSGSWIGDSARPDSVKFYTKSLYSRFGLPSFLDDEGIWLVSHALALDSCTYSSVPTFHYRLHDRSETSKGVVKSSEAIHRECVRALHRTRRLIESLESIGSMRSEARAFVEFSFFRFRAKRISVLNLSICHRLKLCERLTREVNFRIRIICLLIVLSGRALVLVNKLRWRLKFLLR
jgi:glycosyltransferase involved in cell wall biosynthesis